jgi:hypothetical protein
MAPSAISKKAKIAGKTNTNTRSGSIGTKRPSDNRDLHLSSEEDDDIVLDRPLKDKDMFMSKKDFHEKMILLNHPIMKPENREQLELTYRYIDLANSMLRNSSDKQMEMAAMEDDMREMDKAATVKKDGPPFFRGNMSTTILLNGVDQLQRASRARTWSQAILDLMWDARVTVQDFWVVKRQGEDVVSVLVKMSSRYQKILAMGAVNQAREKVSGMYGKAQCRVFARDAFPQAQLEMVQAAYNRGYELKKAGRIQAYRIYNQGGSEPVFEVRTVVDGKSTWGPAPAASGTTPMSRDRSSRRRERREKGDAAENGVEAMEEVTQEGGEEVRSGQAAALAAAATLAAGGSR